MEQQNVKVVIEEFTCSVLRMILWDKGGIYLEADCKPTLTDRNRFTPDPADIEDEEWNKVDQETEDMAQALLECRTELGNNERSTES